MSNEPLRVSIFGMGYVGVVSGACFAQQGHQVIGVDISPNKLSMINSGTSPVVEERIDDIVRETVASGALRATDDVDDAIAGSDVSLISVGTPTGGDGAPALGALDTVTRQIGEALARKGDGEHTVIVRSTVPPGTTRDRVAPALAAASGRTLGQRLHLGFNPEFLREGRSVRDFHAPPFTIIGTDSDRVVDVTRRLYRGIEAPVVETDFSTAEAVKYLCNAFHATKIAFANEAGALLKSLGVDSRRSMQILCEDRELNISPAYLRPGFAFGGSCLPKDLRGLLAFAKQNNVTLPFLDSVLGSNVAHIERAYELITSRGRRKVALFGLAFKPGTDDLRESPLVTLAERLIGRGYPLAIHDREVESSRILGANRAFIEQEIPHFAELLTQDPAQALEGAETIVVGHAHPDALEAIAARAPGRCVIDLQGVDALAAMDGVDYEGICW